MKRLSYLFFLLFTIASCNMFERKSINQDSLAKVIQLDTLDRTNIFNALFKPIVQEWCLWKPTKADSSFPVSDDGYCHTKLDTVMLYRQDTSDMALLILGTYPFENGEKVIMHGLDPPMLGLAVAKKQSNGSWLIISYEKDFGSLSL